MAGPSFDSSEQHRLRSERHDGAVGAKLKRGTVAGCCTARTRNRAAGARTVNVQNAPIWRLEPLYSTGNVNVILQRGRKLRSLLRGWQQGRAANRRCRARSRSRRAPTSQIIDAARAGDEAPAGCLVQETPPGQTRERAAPVAFNFANLMPARRWWLILDRFSPFNMAVSCGVKSTSRKCRFTNFAKP